MNKIISMLGASAFALGLMIDGAEARKVSYEVNGQRYRYDTRDPQQVAVARQRMEAAKAKAKADAEREGSPMVRVFGSEAQRAADEAQEKLDKLIAEQEQATSERRSRQSSYRSERRRKPVQQAREGAERPKQEQSLRAEPVHASIAAAPRLVPQPEPVQQPPVAEATGQPGIKSVSYDIESGIKTTFKTDGTIEEEPFDTSMTEDLVSQQGQTGSLAAFINQLRKAAPEEVTGSIKPKASEADAQAQ